MSFECEECSWPASTAETSFSTSLSSLCLGTETVWPRCVTSGRNYVPQRGPAPRHWTWQAARFTFVAGTAAARSPGRNRNSFWGHQSCSSGIQPRKVASKSQHVPLREAGSAECGMIGQFILGTEPSCSDIISKSLILFSVLDLSAVQTQPG